jgi:hypothetical protein
LPDLGRWSYPLGWRLVRMMVNRIFLPRINALRTTEGLRPDSDVMTQTWAAERLNLIGVSRHNWRKSAYLSDASRLGCAEPGLRFP